MKKATILFKVLMIFFLVISISSCEKDDSTPEENTDVYSRTNVPDKIGVIPPESLNIQTVKSFKGTSFTEPKAYDMLTEEVAFVRHYISDMEIEMMMLDAIFDEILNITGGQSGSIPANTLKITYTKEMEDRINELFPGFNISIAGETEDVPALNLTIYSSDNEGGGYKYKIVYDKSYEQPYETRDYKITIKWSSDENIVYLSRDETLTMGIPPSAMLSTTLFVSIYNSLENTMSINATNKNTQEFDPQYSFDAYNIKMKETGQGNNEIYYDARKFHVDEITELVIDNKIARADDNGGSVLLDFYDWSGSSGYKETFDASGTILSQSSSDDGIVWTGDEILDDFTSFDLSSPNLTLSGFSPIIDKKYCFIIVADGAPTYANDPVGFFSSIIGYIFYEKNTVASAVTDSFNWESINSYQLYEYDDLQYIERNYQVNEVSL